MCLSKAYVARNGERGLLMEDVASVKVGDNRLVMKSLFGEQKEIAATISEIDFLAHTIVLEDLKSSGE